MVVVGTSIVLISYGPLAFNMISTMKQSYEYNEVKNNENIKWTMTKTKNICSKITKY